MSDSVEINENVCFTLGFHLKRVLEILEGFESGATFDELISKDELLYKYKYRTESLLLCARQADLVHVKLHPKGSEIVYEVNYIRSHSNSE
jgi:hypothetical protein